MKWITRTLLVSLTVFSIQTFANSNESPHVAMRVTKLDWGDAFEKFLAGTRFIRMIGEGKVLKSYMNAWNSPNRTNPQEILSHFSDNRPILFRDLLSNGIITDKAKLKDYLEHLYARFPKQRWGIGARAYPSLSTPGEWTVYNSFELYDDVNDEKPSFTGTGMDLFRFADDRSGKLTVDEVHVTVDGLDVSKHFGF